MFIELLDGLRCTADHPQIPLVAAIMERDDRFVIDGILGCPTCRREYPIRNGAAWFSAAANPAARESAPAKGAVVQRASIQPAARDDEEEVMRIGAFLGAVDGITIALVGRWAGRAIELSQLVGLRAFAVNPFDFLGESERVGTLYTDNRLPFADGSLRGVAIDESGWSPRAIGLSARALSPGGRMVAPASSPVPGELEEIARDESVWIAEKRAALVGLHRR